MLITVLRFVFSKLFSFIFFGQIWSQYLKFFKLTVLWYRGRFLNPYFDFNVYFSGILIILIFLDKFGPKSELPQINLNLVQVYIAICLLRFQCLVFPIFCQSYLFGQIWSHNQKFYKMTEISYTGILLYAYYDFNVYFFKILSYFFGQI